MDISEKWLSVELAKANQQLEFQSKRLQQAQAVAMESQRNILLVRGSIFSMENVLKELQRKEEKPKETENKKDKRKKRTSNKALIS